MSLKPLEKIKQFFVYIFTRTVLKHLIIAALLTAFIIWFTFFSLDVYTRHGKSFPLPDFTGKTIEEVIQITKEKKLRFEVTDSVYNKDVPPGTVVEQNPPAGFNVKRNRTVFLTTNAFNVEKVKMPDLVDVTYRQAQAELISYGLMVGRIEYEPDIGKNRVLRIKYNGQEVTENDLVPKGSRIDLVLGAGEEDEIGDGDGPVLPDLIGLTRTDAERRAINSYLNIGNVIYDNSVVSSADTASAEVWKQSPVYTPQTPVALGSSVHIWLTVDETKLRIANADKNDEENVPNNNN